MRVTLVFALFALLLTACRTSDGELRRQVVATWSKETPFSWVDPIQFTDTISPDGRFSESFGHRSEPVTYQGTWKVRNGEFVLTITNALGTGNHQPDFAEVGKVKRWRIIRVDDRQFIYTADGRTNLFTR
jgi:hypothetical protein